MNIMKSIGPMPEPCTIDWLMDNCCDGRLLADSTTVTVLA